MSRGQIFVSGHVSVSVSTGGLTGLGREDRRPEEAGGSGCRPRRFSVCGKSCKMNSFDPREVPVSEHNDTEGVVDRVTNRVSLSS